MMKHKTDVLIIGTGLSGLTAAAKAMESGKKVMLVAKGMGALGLSSGCIDLWGYGLDDPEQVCANPLVEVSRLQERKPKHPYNIVLDVLEESISFFKKLCDENNYPYLANGEGNWLLPTALGTLRPTYLAPASMAIQAIDKIKRFLIVGFEELKDFYPNVIAKNLKNTGRLNPECIFDTVLVSTGSVELNPNNLSNRLEKQDLIDNVTAQLRPHLLPGTVLLFPPVLGERCNSKVAKKLATALGCPVYEVANIPPALPGQRLQQMLLQHIKRQGAEVVIGCTVTGARVEHKRCTEITASGTGKQLTIVADSVVLATGSFLGGGLESRPGEVWESIFNLPVETCPGKWSTREFLSLEGQPFSKFGIKVNDCLQPVNDQMQVLVENLRVVGANLSNCNYSIEKCGNGVALATGYKAGKLVGGAGNE